MESWNQIMLKMEFVNEFQYFSYLEVSLNMINQTGHKEWVKIVLDCDCAKQLGDTFEISSIDIEKWISIE